jgi:hypothetical protein
MQPRRFLLSMFSVEHHDDGWTSVFHTISTPNLHQYELGTATSGTPNDRITKTAALGLNC